MLSVTENYDGMAEHYKNFMLGIKMNMAEFQRMDASARVKQKLYLMAEKGMRVGGSPVLGYDILNKTWVINKAEAKQAVEFFQTYRKTQSVSATTRAMNAKGSVTKSWTTAKGVIKGGKRYSKSTVHRLLRNPVYAGMIRYGGKQSKGQIVAQGQTALRCLRLSHDADLEQVQRTFKPRSGSSRKRWSACPRKPARRSRTC